MARQLIDNLAASWNPEKYTDEYKENLMRVINAKVKGRAPKLVAADHGPKGAEVVDLMARLRASLEGKKGTGESRAKSRGSSKRAAASNGKKAARGRKHVA
jgi:DNA end-binding protein Ku